MGDKTPLGLYIGLLAAAAALIALLPCFWQGARKSWQDYHAADVLEKTDEKKPENSFCDRNVTAKVYNIIEQ